MNYVCYSIEEQAQLLGDRELVHIAKDMAKIFHDAEWWHSSDIDEKDYKETIKWFKDKWLRNGNVDVGERLRGYIDQIFSDAKRECYQLLMMESPPETNQFSISPTANHPTALSIMGKLFNDDDSFKWLTEAVKEKMERERDAKMPI